MSTSTDIRQECNVAELLLAARNGDRSAWEQLIGRYSRLIRSVAAEFRLQESDAADVAQNTWLRLFAYAATIRDPGTQDLCFVVTFSALDVVAHLHECGVTVEEGPVTREGALGAMKSVYCRDPDGNLIEISSYSG